MIEDYAFGRLRVRGETFFRDLIIYPDRVTEGWWRKKGHEVCAEDLQEVLAASPEIVVLGTGAGGRVNMLPEAEEMLRGIGAQVIAQPTEEACQTYNRLVSEGRNVVAALHLTC